jgi:hypothetical protein
MEKIYHVDVLYEVMLFLDIEDIIAMCEYKLISKVCQDAHFWRAKFEKDKLVLPLHFYPNWIDAYISAYIDTYAKFTFIYLPMMTQFKTLTGSLVKYFDNARIRHIETGILYFQYSTVNLYYKTYEGYFMDVSDNYKELYELFIRNHYKDYNIVNFELHDIWDERVLIDIQHLDDYNLTKLDTIKSIYGIGYEAESEESY